MYEKAKEQQKGGIERVIAEEERGEYRMLNDY